jgi:hypothetical protein
VPGTKRQVGRLLPELLVGSVMDTKPMSIIMHTKPIPICLYISAAKGSDKAYKGLYRLYSRPEMRECCTIEGCTHEPKCEPATMDQWDALMARLRTDRVSEATQ